MKKILLTIMAFSIIAIANAQSPEERGLEIAKAAEQADIGFLSSIVNLKMVLKNKNGQTSERNLTTKTLELNEDGDKSLIVFDSPKDVKGTATLTFTHKIGADDQWLFLPSIQRVKRISSNNKSGPFVGSEFAYEDLSSQEVEKYTYKYLGDEEFAGLDCYMVERDPVDPKSGYKRQIVWFDKEHYRVQKIDFYDRKDSKMKTLTYVGYKKYLDKYWRSDKMMMVNHQTGKSTDLVWKEYKFGNGFVDRDFNESTLKRTR